MTRPNWSGINQIDEMFAEFALTRAFAKTALVAVLLAACGGDREQSVVERLNAGSTSPADEFQVLPRKPLELPEDLTALPDPQPGARSRTDLTPIEDAEVALTGRVGRGTATGADAALVAAAGGRDPNIRATLRTEDQEWREENRGRLLERLFNRTTEGIVYRRMILDAETELDQLRQRGVWVPAAPPE